MNIERIVSELDTEIARLKHIREVLLGGDGTHAAAPQKSNRGRPKGSKNAATKKTTAPAKSLKKGKRVLSPEGRQRIAEAMKRRWAERRKQSAR